MNSEPLGSLRQSPTLTSERDTVAIQRIADEQAERYSETRVSKWTEHEERRNPHDD